MFHRQQNRHHRHHQCAVASGLRWCGRCRAVTHVHAKHILVHTHPNVYMTTNYATPGRAPSHTRMCVCVLFRTHFLFHMRSTQPNYVSSSWSSSPSPSYRRHHHPTVIIIQPLCQPSPSLSLLASWSRISNRHKLPVCMCVCVLMYVYVGVQTHVVCESTKTEPIAPWTCWATGRWNEPTFCAYIYIYIYNTISRNEVVAYYCCCSHRPSPPDVVGIVNMQHTLRRHGVYGGGHAIRTVARNAIEINNIISFFFRFRVYDNKKKVLNLSFFNTFEEPIVLQYHKSRRINSFLYEREL